MRQLLFYTIVGTLAIRPRGYIAEFTAYNSQMIVSTISVSIIHLFMQVLIRPNE